MVELKRSPDQFVPDHTDEVVQVNWPVVSGHLRCLWQLFSHGSVA